MYRLRKAIEKSEIEKMPTVQYGGVVTVIESEEQAREVIDNVLSREPEVGFDTETRPSFKKGMMNKVALVQISTHRTCYLFRLNKMGMPQCLIDFLEAKQPVKVGLSLNNDYLALRRRKEFAPAGFVDLQTSIKEFGIQEQSLQKIFAILFGEKISKSQRLTNWESPQLEERQKIYAATDAWACLKIYNRLKELRKSGDYKLIEEETTATQNEQ